MASYVVATIALIPKIPPGGGPPEKGPKYDTISAATSRRTDHAASPTIAQIGTDRKGTSSGNSRIGAATGPDRRMSMLPLRRCTEMQAVVDGSSLKFLTELALKFDI